MIAFMDAHPEVGLAGPKVLNPDGTRQDSVSYRYPGHRYGAADHRFSSGRNRMCVGRLPDCQREAAARARRIRRGFLFVRRRSGYLPENPQARIQKSGSLMMRLSCTTAGRVSERPYRQRSSERRFAQSFFFTASTTVAETVQRICQRQHRRQHSGVSSSFACRCR